MADDEIPDLFPGAVPSAPGNGATRSRMQSKASSLPRAREAGTGLPVSKQAADPLALDYGTASASDVGGAAAGELIDELEFDPISSRNAEGSEKHEPVGVRGSGRVAGSVVELDFSDPAYASSGSGQVLRGDSPLNLEPAAPASRSAVSPRLEAERPSPHSVPALDTGQSPKAGTVLSKGAKRVRSGAVSAAPPQENAPTFPGIGADVDLGGELDDLDFGGASAAQLNVAVEVPREDGVPWPSGKTPELSDVQIDEEEVSAISGFGPAPKGVFSAPLYFLRVALALRDLRERVRAAHTELMAVESSRDERLCRMAEERRSELSAKDRFSVLYEGVGKHDEEIARKRDVLKTVDSEGAGELRDIGVMMDALVQARGEKEEERDARRTKLESSEMGMKRAEAVLRKAQIGIRNLQEQEEAGYDFGVVSFELRLEALEREEAEAKASIDKTLKERVSLSVSVEAAEDKLRQVVAEVLALEAKKEGLLMAFEGEIAEHSRALDEAISARRKDLADAGRVILDLRGEVPVEERMRRELLEVDDRVRETFVNYQTAQDALNSMDHETFRLGRSLWIGLGVAFLLLLVVGAIF